MPDSDFVLDHVIRKLRKVDIIPSPYPHFFVENIFPDDYYAKLLRYMPATSILQEDSSGWPSQDVNYHRMNLSQDLGSLSGEEKAFWEDTEGWLLSARFTDAVFKYCSRYVIRHRNPIQRFKVKALKKFAPNCSLHRISGEYELKIHTDSRRKLISLLFYLPKDETSLGFGTGVYRPKAKGLEDTGRGNFEFADFDKVYMAPFQANTLFGFVKNDHSFHGVETIPADIQGRDALLYNINIAD